MERFVVLTGLSGAGKTTAMHALEDLGFYTVDNVPPSLWADLVTQAEASGHDRLAIGIDIRTRAFIDEVESVLDTLKQAKLIAEVVFLDASDDVLVKRYNLTRRTHPLGQAALSGDISTERLVLGPLRALADVVLDTTQFSAKDLKETLWERFGSEQRFHLRIMSFGFKRGVPIDADNVFDLRALPNPYYSPVLRPIDGRDERVQNYVFTPVTLEFYTQLCQFVSRLTSMAMVAGRRSYTVAVGCTGGQHRSVAVAERLAHDLADTFAPQIEHRDVEEALLEHKENHATT